MCNKCNGSCNSCNCTCQEPCLTPDCACKVFITTDCVTLTEDLTCSNIPKGLTTTEVLKQLDAYICERFGSVESFFQLVNIGNGSEIYKGISVLGKKELRTLISDGTIEIIQNSDTISLNINIDSLEKPPLQRIDQGNGEGIIIRGRQNDNYLPIGSRAVDLSYSYSAFPLTGASGNNSFAANTRTIASGEDSAAFNNGQASELMSFAINDAIASNFASFAFGSGQSTGQYAVSGGVDSIASNQAAVAIGTSTKAPGFSSCALNQETESIGGLSLSTGHSSKSRGQVSHAGGDHNETDSHGETSIGVWGTIKSGNPSSTIFVPTDRLFNIGNGFINPQTSVSTRSDALTLLKNGLLTLPSVTNALITGASGKAVVTKEYLVSQIPVIPIPDGSETKVNSGTNISVTGNGTIATPYVINNIQTIDGSETKLISGTNNTVTGNGTIATPYQINVPIPDGSETKINSSTLVITGNGTIATPYVINNAINNVRNIGWFSGLDVALTTGVLTVSGDIDSANVSPIILDSTVVVTLSNPMDNMNYYVRTYLESLSANINDDDDICTPVFQKISTTQFSLAFREMEEIVQNLKVHIEVVQI